MLQTLQKNEKSMNLSLLVSESTDKLKTSQNNLQGQKNGSKSSWILDIRPQQVRIEG